MHTATRNPFSKFYLRIQRFHSFLLFSLGDSGAIFLEREFPVRNTRRRKSVFRIDLDLFLVQCQISHVSPSLSLCILIPLISKRSFELTFRGSRIVVHVVIFVLSFSLLLFLDGDMASEFAYYIDR